MRREPIGSGDDRAWLAQAPDGPAQILPVTVVITARDRSEMIRSALASVSAQRPWQPAEVLVVDDASSDGTARTAEELGARVLRHERSLGAAAARNTGVAAATQPWVALLDSDDEWLPHHLATVWAIRDGHVLVGASALACGSDPAHDRFQGAVGGRPVILSSPAALIYPENFIVASTVLVQREIVRQVGGYDTGLRYSEDFDLWLRVLERGTGVVAPRVSCLYRRHPGQKSAGERDRKAAQVAIARSYAGRPWWSQELVEKRAATGAWDHLRTALRAGQHRDAAVTAAWIVSRPRRLAAVAAMWRRRWLKRRLGASVGRDGEAIDRPLDADRGPDSTRG